MSIWFYLRRSFWFLPALMCVGAVVLAQGLIFVDGRLSDGDLGVLDFLITRVGESGSRDLLGAIAGSMLTVASTTFSITIAVLALASSTYGPRLVRNFMSDRGNQFVLGIFVATFLYSLLVLRSIRVLGDGDGDYFVPHLAVNVAVLLALLSIGVLVYFIHHISDSVQVSTLAEQVRLDLRNAVDRLFPEPTEAHVRPAGGTPDVPEEPETDGAVLVARRAGYVQGIDLSHVLATARDNDLLIAVRIRPGQHVTEGSPIAVGWPAAAFDEEVRDSTYRAVRLGRSRDPEQDVEFPALLLEEMAVRALSPGTNDPYTAINALDDLAGGLVNLAGRPPAPTHHYDDDGRLRVIAPQASLLGIVDHLLDAMRHYALAHPTVLHRSLELLAQVGGACPDPAVKRHMAMRARRLVDEFESTSPNSHDQRALSEHAERVQGQLLQ